MKYDLAKVIANLFRIELYPYQLRFLNDCLKHKRIIGAWSRQTGKSTVIAILAVLAALEQKGCNVLIVGPTDRQAGELFKKITDFLKDSPFGGEIEKSTLRQMVINGSRIVALPVGSSGDTIRGMTAHTLILEEASYIKDGVVSQVLLPMIAATGGRVIKIGTPFGMNHFYKSFQEDEAWVSHHITWKDAVEVGHFTQGFIDEQRRACTGLEFRTEYEAAFIPDVDTYFGWGLVQSCVEDYELEAET